MPNNRRTLHSRVPAEPPVSRWMPRRAPRADGPAREITPTQIVQELCTALQHGNNAVETAFRTALYSAYNSAWADANADRLVSILKDPQHADHATQVQTLENTLGKPNGKLTVAVQTELFGLLFPPVKDKREADLERVRNVAKIEGANLYTYFQRDSTMHEDAIKEAAALHSRNVWNSYASDLQSMAVQELHGYLAQNESDIHPVALDGFRWHVFTYANGVLRSGNDISGQCQQIVGEFIANAITNRDVDWLQGTASNPIAAEWTWKKAMDGLKELGAKDELEHLSTSSLEDRKAYAEQLLAQLQPETDAEKIASMSMLGQLNHAVEAGTVTDEEAIAQGIERMMWRDAPYKYDALVALSMCLVSNDYHHYHPMLLKKMQELFDRNGPRLLRTSIEDRDPVALKALAFVHEKSIYLPAMQALKVLTASTLNAAEYLERLTYELPKGSRSRESAVNLYDDWLTHTIQEATGSRNYDVLEAIATMPAASDSRFESTVANAVRILREKGQYDALTRIDQAQRLSAREKVRLDARDKVAQFSMQIAPAHAAQEGLKGILEHMEATRLPYLELSTEARAAIDAMTDPYALFTLSYQSETSEAVRAFALQRLWQLVPHDAGHLAELASHAVSTSLIGNVATALIAKDGPSIVAATFRSDDVTALSYLTSVYNVPSIYEPAIRRLFELRGNLEARQNLDNIRIYVADDPRRLLLEQLEREAGVAPAATVAPVTAPPAPALDLAEPEALDATIQLDSGDLQEVTGSIDPTSGVARPITQPPPVSPEALGGDLRLDPIEAAPTQAVAPPDERLEESWFQNEEAAPPIRTPELHDPMRPQVTPEELHALVTTSEDLQEKAAYWKVPTRSILERFLRLYGETPTIDIGNEDHMTGGLYVAAVLEVLDAQNRNPDAIKGAMEFIQINLGEEWITQYVPDLRAGLRRAQERVRRWWRKGGADTAIENVYQVLRRRDEQ